MKIDFTKAPDGFSYLISQKEAKSIFKPSLTEVEIFRLKFAYKTKGIPSDIQYLATYDYSAFETVITIWAVPVALRTADTKSLFEQKICPYLGDQIQKHNQNNYSQNQDGYIAIVNDAVYSFSRLNTYGLPTSEEWRQAVKTGKAKQLKN